MHRQAGHPPPSFATAAARPAAAANAPATRNYSAFRNGFPNPQSLSHPVSSHQTYREPDHRESSSRLLSMRPSGPSPIDEPRGVGPARDRPSVRTVGKAGGARSRISARPGCRTGSDSAPFNGAAREAPKPSRQSSRGPQHLFRKPRQRETRDVSPQPPTNPYKAS